MNEQTPSVPAVIEHQPSPTLINGAVTPKQLVERATEMANALAPIVEDKKLYVKIGKGKHLVMEAWSTLGAMVGVFPEVDWTRPIEGGWEARCQVRHMGSGQIIGAAEAQCLSSEQNWKGKEDFAIRSMAQTRAAGKAMRLPLSWIVVLGGYAPTPAEEMDHTPEAPAQPKQARSRQATAQPGANGGDQHSAKARYELTKALDARFKGDEQAVFEYVQGKFPEACEGTTVNYSKIPEAMCAELIEQLPAPAKQGELV